MQDFFPSMTLKPNPACEEMMCQQRQREYQVTPSQKLASEGPVDPHSVILGGPFSRKGA